MTQLRNGAVVKWDFCGGVLPGGINPTDIDLAFEHRGEFLILEGKQEGEQMPRGQWIFLNALAAMSQFTVVEFVGVKPNIVHRYRLWDAIWTDTTTERFNAEVIEHWHRWVRRELP